MKSNLSPRAEELLIERTMRRLSDREHAELEALGAADDASYDVAAAAAAVAVTPIEAMPASITAKLLAAAPRPDFTRTLAGHLAAPAIPRDTLPGVDLASFAPPALPAPDPQPIAPAPIHEAPVIPIGTRQRVEPPRRSSSVAPWMAAAACLAIAAGGVWYGVREHGRLIAQVEAPKPAIRDARAALLAEHDDAATIAWTATKDPTANGASGDVVWSPSQQRGYMRFVGLAANDPREFQYQLWIFDKERDQAYPVDGGVFDVSSTGEVIVPITARIKVADATLFAVTVEKPGGVVVSKRERIVVTAARS